jgi:hypothetical protein
VGSTYERQLPQSPERVASAISEAAETWGAAWQSRPGGGQLDLPTVQGLRRGVLAGDLQIEPSDGGSRLRLEVASTHTAINWSATAVLVLGGLGGLTLVVWPLSPKILQLAPIGAVLAIVAWLLVVSRLRYSDAGDFLDLVAEIAEHS